MTGRVDMQPKEERTMIPDLDQRLALAGGKPAVRGRVPIHSMIDPEEAAGVQRVFERRLPQ